jgi:hypothetical protein
MNMDNTTPRHRIDGALDVVVRPHAMIAVDECKSDVPSVNLSEAKLAGWQKFLATSQLGRIERTSQVRSRQLVANAGLQILRERLEAVVAANRELLAPALEEVRLVVESFNHRIRSDFELREQRAGAADILEAFKQYRDAVAGIPDDTEDETRTFLRTAFTDDFYERMAKLRSIRACRNDSK